MSSLENVMNDKNTAIVSHSLQEIHKMFPGAIREASQEFTDFEGNKFTSKGVTFGRYFIQLSKKLCERGISGKQIFEDADAYQVMEKTGVRRADGSPIYVICDKHDFTTYGDEIAW